MVEKWNLIPTVPLVSHLVYADFCTLKKKKKTKRKYHTRKFNISNPDTQLFAAFLS